jgi:catechol 2,3-dioxygenase-like lactoylglutathione lyase family enzyme
MDNVGIVVEDLNAAIEFFTELGLTLEGRMPIEGEWAGREDIDDTLARLGKLGATVVDEVVNYEHIYRLCYIRGPEGILIGLAQQFVEKISRENLMERKR